MKYKFFMALAAVGLMTACSNNDTILDEGEEPSITIPENKDDLVSLTIGVASPSTKTTSSSTRGAGVVGGINSADNVWKKQTLWLFMMNKGTVKPSQFITSKGTESMTIRLFNNKRMIAPNNVASGLLTPTDGAVNYYPMAGNFDFWGYYVDDAAITSTGTSIDLTDSLNAPEVKYVNISGNEVSASYAEKVLVPVKIDGSQDLMAGKATLGKSETDLLPSGNNDRYYSAYAAKKGIDPNIQFKHLLTRFTFNVVAGDKTSAGKGEDGKTKALSVTDIQVRSHTTGNMVVAYKSEPSKMIEWDNTYSWLSLKEKSKDSTIKTLQSLTPKVLEWADDAENGTVLPLGESLLVYPNQTSYDVNIRVTQWVQINENEPETAVAGTNKPTDYDPSKPELVAKYKGTWSLETHVFKTTVELSDNTKFQAGTSYDVTVYLYGLTQIVSKSTLGKWDKGEDITANKQ